MTAPEDVPQDTAAAAYSHAARLVDAVAERARRTAPIGEPRAWVRVERVEHLVDRLRRMAEEAARVIHSGPPEVCTTGDLADTVQVGDPDPTERSGPLCNAEHPGPLPDSYVVCRRTPHSKGTQHVATDGLRVVAVWR